MNNNVKKIIVSGSLFMASLASLSGATYAWYTFAKSVTLDNISMSVSDADKFSIGLMNNDGTIDYYQDITKDILLAHNQYSNNAKLEPVSSMYRKLWDNESLDLSSTEIFPIFRSLNNNDINKGIVALHGYYNLEFYLQSNRDMYVYLSEDSVISADHASNITIANEKQLNVEDLDKVSKTIRTSFLSPNGFKIYKPNNEEKAITKFANRLDFNSDGTGYFDIDPITNNELIYGEYNIEDNPTIIYSEEARISQIVGNGSVFNAKSNPFANPFDLQASINAEENPLVITNESSYSIEQLSSTESIDNSLIYLKKGIPTRMVVSIYEEGWDLNHVDSIKYSAFNVNLVFKAKIAYNSLKI